MFDLSWKHHFGFYDIHVDMYAYIVAKYVYHTILRSIISLCGISFTECLLDQILFPTLLDLLVV
jgi:hypothetical protein